MKVLKHLDLQWWKKSFPEFKQIGFPVGHLFPLEAPEKLGNLLQSILIDLTEEHAEKSEKPLFEVAWKNVPFSWQKSDFEKHAPFFDHLDFHPASGQIPTEKFGVDSL